MLRFLVAILLCAVASFIIVQYTIDTKPSFLLQSTVFLTFATVVVFRYLYRINKPDTFVQLYLFMMAVKLMGYGAYVFFMISSDKANAMANVAYFLVLYLVFTAVEVFFLFKKINQ